MNLYYRHWASSTTVILVKFSLAKIKHTPRKLLHFVKARSPKCANIKFGKNWIFKDNFPKIKLDIIVYLYSICHLLVNKSIICTFLGRILNFVKSFFLNHLKTQGDCRLTLCNSEKLLTYISSFVNIGFNFIVERFFRFIELLAIFFEQKIAFYEIIRDLFFSWNLFLTDQGIRDKVTGR